MAYRGSAIPSEQTVVSRSQCVNPLVADKGAGMDRGPIEGAVDNTERRPVSHRVPAPSGVGSVTAAISIPWRQAL